MGENTVRSSVQVSRSENYLSQPQTVARPSSFCFRFLAICCTSFLLATIAPPGWLEPLNKWTASLTRTFIDVLGFDAQVRGTLLSVDGFQVKIIPECTPLYPVLLLVSFILAYPATLKSRLFGVLVGTILLVFLNGIRVAGLILVGWKKPALFEWVHVYLGQVAIVLCVIAVCFLWIRLGTGPQLKDMRLRFFIRFAVFSGVLLLIWAEFNRGYISAGDAIIREIFSWWGYKLSMPIGHTLYYHTFNVVAFSALLLATTSIDFRMRIQWLIAGLVVLVVLHLAVRVCNVLVTGLKVESALMFSSLATVLAQYLVPFFLWVWIVKSKTNRRQFNLADSK